MGSCCGTSEEAKRVLKEQSVAEGRGPSVWERLESVQELLESWPMLAVAGASLVLSFLAGGECGDHGSLLKVLPHDFEYFAAIPLFICGLPVLKEALEALFVERRIRAALLISTAMIACTAIGQLFAAGEVAFIMALGEMLEGWTVNRAKKGLHKLVALVPQTARKVVTCPKCRARGEFFREVSVGEIAVGDGVMIKPGETIPVDGTVTEGATSVDQSVMTGESLPVDKAVGDEVYSGTVNRFGAITIRVTKAGEDSSLQKLIRMVREAESKKAPMQRIADRWAAILVPCSMTIAILTFFGVWAFTGDVHEGLMRGVTIMVVFCPCALALATPTSVMAAIGQATKFGVIVKSGEALEKMGHVSVACFDKTGTLTTGRLSVAWSTDAETLALAAAVEAKSEHPLAKAICAAAGKSAPCEDFSMIPGKGVKGTVDGKLVVCGTGGWLAENGVAPDDATLAEAGRLRGEGKAVVFVGTDGKCRGLVALADTIRDDARAALESLARTNVSTCLLTGDHKATAAFVAKELGVAEVRAELLPEDKAKAIAEIERGGCLACMVGDGVNDAVAL